MVSLALSATPPLIDPSAYHAQQAVEKALKALLVLRAAPVPRSHDIGYLLGLTGLPPGLDPAQADELAAITSWAVQTRYPSIDEGGGPSFDEVEALLPVLDLLLEVTSSSIEAVEG